MKIVSFGGGCNVGQVEADVVKEAGGEFELLPEFDYVDATAGRYSGVTAVLFRRLAVSREMFLKLPDCIAAARYGAGLEAVDLEAATDLGILVVSNHTYGPDAVSSWAKSLFHTVRGEIHAWHQTVLDGDWRNDYPIISKPVSTLTAGVVGLGTIGQTLVPQLQGEFKRVVGYDLYADKSAAVVKDGLVELLDERESLLEVSNVVFILQGNNEAALVEFIGHMPIIGVALLLMLLGYGQRLKITHAFSAGRHRSREGRQPIAGAPTAGQTLNPIRKETAHDRV